MTIENQRARQRQAQQQAIEQRRSSEGISRIGPRDPETGRYNILSPDGSNSRDGIKIFTAQIGTGPVNNTPRSDGKNIVEPGKGPAPIGNPRPPLGPMAPPVQYREGRVFEIPEKGRQFKGPIHILYSDSNNRLWVGGHQDEPEEVIFPANPHIKFYSIWADGAGWIVTRRNPRFGLPGERIESIDSDGVAYSSPASPDGKFIRTFANESGSVGFGTTVLYDFDSPNQFQGSGNAYVWQQGRWAYGRSSFTIPSNAPWNYSISLPIALFPPNVTISKSNEYADVPFGNGVAYGRVWTCVGIDRESTILKYFSEDYDSGIYSGYFELVGKNGTAQQFLPYSYNIVDNSGTQPAPIFGNYTDSVFTVIPFGTSVLKTAANLIFVDTTSFNRSDPNNVQVIVTRDQLPGSKIPDDANILASCSTIS